MARPLLRCVTLLSMLLSLPALAVGAEKGGTPLHSLDPKVLLPDGTEFLSWEAEPAFTKTCFVDQAHAQASDDGPGTAERPWKTIGKAAATLQPGERVVVAAGVYREHVRPARGGESPAKMISYEAAPGAAVVLKGSQVFTEKWTPSEQARGVWNAPLPARYFSGYNPFDTDNVTAEQFEIMKQWAWDLRGQAPYTLPRGLVFQDGACLRQVAAFEELKAHPGTYWVDRKTPALAIRPLRDADPNGLLIEITTQRIAFGPAQHGLGFVRVKGFTVEQVGNAFPMQQEGAISTWRGHHWIIEDNSVRWANGVGIDVGIQAGSLPQPPVVGHHIVRRNTIEDIGVCGIAGIGVPDDFHLLIEENVLRRCAFHDVERLYETGAIKTHINTGCLIRRNLIVDTLHGPGIWMDWCNANSRCTQNVVLGTRTKWHGALFIEASSRPNLLDHNVLWGTTGNGIYEHDGSNQLFVHNFIARSTKAAVLINGKVTDRLTYGQPIVPGGHTVANNVFYANGVNRVAAGRNAGKNRVVANLDEGITAELNRGTLTLTWGLVARIPLCTPVPGVTHDFFGRPRDPKRLVPGPFSTLPSGLRTEVLWPPKKP